MWYVIIFIIALLSFVYTSIGVNRTDGAINDANTIKASEKVAQKVIYSSDEIKVKLKKLKKKKKAQILKEQKLNGVNYAMCYAPIADPVDVDRKVEYVCPICGTKTLYASSSLENYTLNLVQYLPKIRREIDSIHGVELALDENQLCKKCNREPISDPRIFFTIKMKDDSASRRIDKMNYSDFYLLKSFFTGYLSTQKYLDTLSLNNDIKRLEKLIGIKIDK